MSRVSRVYAASWMFRPVVTQLGVNGFPVRIAEKMPRLQRRVQVAFQANRQVYGSPRIHAELRVQGRQCGRKRVARLMRELQVSAQFPRHRTITTKSEKGVRVADNVLQRDFHADEPNCKWVTDTTSIWTREGWLYLAVVLDLFSRLVVGWSIATIQDTTLVERALQMALARRSPAPRVYCIILIEGVPLPLKAIKRS